MSGTPFDELRHFVGTPPIAEMKGRPNNPIAAGLRTGHRCRPIAEVGLDLQTSAGRKGAMVLNSNRWGFMPRPGVPMTKAQDIMTFDVCGVSPSDSFEVAATLLKRLDVGSLPVMACDRLPGMLTDRDFTARGVGSGLARRHPFHIDPCVRAVSEPGLGYQQVLHLKDGLT